MTSSPASTPNCAPSTLYIGDNYDFLRSLNNTCIDLIAIDPPFAANETFTSRPKPPITDEELRLERELAEYHGKPHDDDEHPKSQERQTRVKDIWRWDDSLHVQWKEGVREDYPAVFSVIDAVQACATDNEAAYIAFMASRLIECQRVLKPTGSIYVHCNHDANSYLRMLMDAIFGAENFRNAIAWRRTNSKNAVQKDFGRNYDTILRYSNGGNATFNKNAVRVPYDESSGAPDGYKWSNAHQDYVAYSPLHAPGIRYGDSGMPASFRGKVYHPPPNRHWVVPGERKSGETTSEGWARLDAEGKIYLADNGRYPMFIRKLASMQGIALDDFWFDISIPSTTEDTGYSTQKPLELYERIIKASSNEGDVVLDIFAGCATTAVAAQRWGRKWIACDIAYRSYTMLKRRFYLEGMHADPPEATKQALANVSKTLRKTAGVSGSGKRTAQAYVAPQLSTVSISIIGPNELPVRTDADPSPAHELKVVRHDKATGWSGRIPKEEAKQLLIARFGEKCWGCGFEPVRPNGSLDAGLLEVDHIRARNPQEGVGGNDELYNLALLHPTCNKLKSNRMRTLEELRDHHVHKGTLWVKSRNELVDLHVAQEYAFNEMVKRGIQQQMPGLSG